MKILQVTPTYLPATRYGGPIWSVHGLSRSLVSLGHQVDVFTTNIDGSGISDVPLDETIEMDDVHVRYFSSDIPRLYLSRTMNQALRHEARAYDIIHTHAVFLWPTAAASRAATRAGVPSVISPRGMLVRELVRKKGNLRKTLWIRLVETGNFGRAAGIHFTSRMERREADVFRLPLRNPFIVPNGVEVYDEPPDAPRDGDVVFLGRVTWKKDIGRLISTLPLVPSARLNIVGNDEEGLTSQLILQAKHLGCADRLHFAGAVSRGEARNILRRARVLVLTSRSENFGNVVLEAFAEACPVIVSSEVGAAEIVLESGGGRVIGSGPEELSQALRSAYEDPEIWSVRGRRGYDYVRTRLTWRHVALQMESEYRMIIDHSGER